MTRPRKDLQGLYKVFQYLRKARETTGPNQPLAQQAFEEMRKYLDMHQFYFSDWLLCNQRLDAETYGLSIMDIDWIVHRCKVASDKNGERTVQHLMILEVKCCDASLQFAQSDTKNALHGLFKKRIRHRSRKNRIIIYCGYHVLTFSGYGPLDSKSIRWDGKEITVDQLEKLIRFELDANTLRSRDLTERRHHANLNNFTPLFDSRERPKS
jgi:hypothetical protein